MEDLTLAELKDLSILRFLPENDEVKQVDRLVDAVLKRGEAGSTAAGAEAGSMPSVSSSSSSKPPKAQNKSEQDSEVSRALAMFSGSCIS